MLDTKMLNIIILNHSVLIQWLIYKYPPNAVFTIFFCYKNVFKYY